MIPSIGRIIIYNKYIGKIANEDFWSPPRPSPPYRIDFAKIRKKSESTQNGLIRREIEKKIFAPW